jgi:hypothetical protein
MRGIRRSSALVEASALASEEELRRCGMLESLKRDIPVLVVNESSLRTILPGAVAAAIVPGEIPLSLGRASSRLRSILERQELPYDPSGKAHDFSRGMKARSLHHRAGPFPHHAGILS